VLAAVTISFVEVRVITSPLMYPLSGLLKYRYCSSARRQTYPEFQSYLYLETNHAAGFVSILKKLFVLLWQYHSSVMLNPPATRH
jgi:hypothetical protein